MARNKTAGKKEVVSGITSDDVREMADTVFNWKDGNRPMRKDRGNNLLKILQNSTPDISASPVFLRKVAQ